MNEHSRVKLLGLSSVRIGGRNDFRFGSHIRLGNLDCDSLRFADDVDDWVSRYLLSDCKFGLRLVDLGEYWRQRRQTLGRFARNLGHESLVDVLIEVKCLAAAVATEATHADCKWNFLLKRIEALVFCALVVARCNGGRHVWYELSVVVEHVLERVDGIDLPGEIVGQQLLQGFKLDLRMTALAVWKDATGVSVL